MSATSTSWTEIDTFPSSQNAEPSSKSALELQQDEDDTQKSFEERDAPAERMRDFFLQSLIPFLIAGAGLIGSGKFINLAKEWTFMQSNREVIVLIPAFIGMKGNIEMSFSSRLSTMIDEKKTLWKVLYTNAALLQAQSVLLSLFALMVLFVVRLIEGYTFDVYPSVLVTSAAVVAASVSSVVMMTIMSLVVYSSRACGINPDNVTAPLAASLGDFVAMSSFLGIGTLLLEHCGQEKCYLSVGLLLALLLTCPVWAFISTYEDSNIDILKFGWWAPMVAVMISCGAGFVLDFGMKYYDAMEAFAPLIGGLGGNRCAVQSSRISTSLHTSRFMAGTLPLGSLLTYLNPIRAFFSRDTDSRTAQVLILSSIPGQLLFVSVLLIVLPKSWNLVFVASYLVAALIQILILLYFTQILVYTLWRIRINPDHSSIPLITSIGDLIGTSLLLGVFYMLSHLNPSSIWREEV